MTFPELCLFTLTRFLEGPMAPSYTYTKRVRRQNLEYSRKAHRRLRSWHRRLPRAQFRTEQGLWFRVLPGSTDSNVYVPSSNESDGRLRLWSHHCPTRPTCPSAPSKFINHNAIMGERIMVSRKSIVARSLAIFWLFTRLVGPTRIPHLGWLP